LLLVSLTLINPTRTLAAKPNTNAGVNGAITTIAPTGFWGQMGQTVGCDTDPSTNLGALVTFFVCTLSRYATAIAVLIIMIAGLMYVLSGSNPSMAGTAKSVIVTTITGLIAMYSISLILSILISSGIVSKDPTAANTTTTTPAPTPTPTPTPTPVPSP